MPSTVLQPLFVKNPEFYAMSCPQCGWKETLELAPCEMDVITLDGEAPKSLRSVTELPKRCPECGAGLKKDRLPIKVVN